MSLTRGMTEVRQRGGMYKHSSLCLGCGRTFGFTGRQPLCCDTVVACKFCRGGKRGHAPTPTPVATHDLGDGRSTVAAVPHHGEEHP